MHVFFQTLSYMIFGVFESPEIVNPELIPQMLKCAKQFQLRMTQFDDDIGRVLIFQLFKVSISYIFLGICCPNKLEMENCKTKQQKFGALSKHFQDWTETELGGKC